MLRSKSKRLQGRGTSSSSRHKLELYRSVRRLSDGASAAFRQLWRQDQGSNELPQWNRTIRTNRSSQTFISCLIDDLQWALQSLGGSTTWQPLEQMAIFIHESLSSESRGYHSVERVFQVTGGAAPVQLIAAFFRDTVDHFIDGELTPQKMQKLQGVFLPGTYCLAPAVWEDDSLRMVAELFGIRVEEDLEHKYQWKHGMDIFLAAIVVVRFLRDILAPKSLAEIVCCLEATIPFRPKDAMGRSTVDHLYTRLLGVNQDHAMGMTDQEMERCCQMSVDLHNRIMGTFASPDVPTFIDHTWSLLPEQYASLRRTALYSTNDFYFAVLDMHDFVANVQATSIVNSFRGIPQDWEIQEFQRLFAKNQTLGVAYLKVKSVELGLVVALAILSGGADVPNSLFWGDLPQHKSDVSSPVLGDGLSPLEIDMVATDCYMGVYELLNCGRTRVNSFDHRNAPVAAYVYGSIGEEGLKATFAQCVYPLTEETSWNILKSLPYHVVEVVGREVSDMAPSRAEPVQKLLRNLI
jgi:hypothetical protein